MKTLDFGNTIFCTRQRIRPCMSCQAVSLNSFTTSPQDRTLAISGKRIVVSGEDLCKVTEISRSDFKYGESNLPNIDYINTMFRHDDLIPSAQILRSNEIAVISIWRVIVLLVILDICMALPGITQLISGDGFNIAAVLSGLVGVAAMALLSLISVVRNGLRSEETAPVFLTRTSVTKRATLSARDKEILRSLVFLFLAMFDEKAVFSRDDTAPYLGLSHGRTEKKPALFEETISASEFTKNMGLVCMSNANGDSIWLDTMNMKVLAVKQRDGLIQPYGWECDVPLFTPLQRGITYEENTQVSSIPADREESINLSEKFSSYVLVAM